MHTLAVTYELQHKCKYTPLIFSLPPSLLLSLPLSSHPPLPPFHPLFLTHLFSLPLLPPYIWCRDRSSGFIHLRIVYERSGYVLGQFSSHFQTVPECIFFYTQQRLNIRGTEHKKLRFPVSRDRYRDT